MMEPGNDWRLTRLTNCGGCAAKLGADILEGVLKRLGGGTVPGELLAGLDPPDDAAAYEVSPGMAVLASLDFFPPVVDDPFTYGSIAAANAVSDIYAMGGRVLLGLNIAAVPESLPTSALDAIFAGGIAVMRQAGGVLAGGHTLRDGEPKYGLAVVGIGAAESLMLRSKVAPGDILMLTKRLGTGLVISGRRQSRSSDAALQAATASMLQLNRAAAEALVASSVRAATDVTGFGLLGHALEMATASGVRMVVSAGSLPALPEALELAELGVRTDGSQHNRRFVDPWLTRQGTVDPRREELAFDPQTSGGLLAAVPRRRLAELEQRLSQAGVEAWIVGEAAEGAGVLLAA